MDFALSEEQQILVETVKQFTIKEVQPWIHYIDENQNTDLGHKKARAIFKKAAELGLTAMGYPEDVGGVKSDPITIGLACEALGTYGGLPQLESGQPLCGPSGPGLVLAVEGTKEQKEEWIAKIIAGDRVVSIGSTEPHCGSDVSQIKTAAKRDGEDYIINGEKQMVGGSRWSDAHLVYCRTSDEPGAKGISAILVENDRPGVERYQFKTLGGSFWEIGGIRYKDVHVPTKNLIGREGRGFYLAMGMFDWMRSLAGCFTIGLAQRALDECVEYVKQRQAFGQPVGKWEAVQFRIAESATLLEAARWLSYRALWLAATNKPYTKEASMVKWWVPTVAFNVVNDCMQNLGATGYTTNSYDELRLRYIRALWVADGTIDIQKIVIGREILGREFVPYRREKV
ncbi:MAG: acyl-CoA dehydrogenase family protein [Thaumarchaeota archaeon]|nr:acyl-CoA dehydrogenase family protein [Nitrososphaerota archaeon]